METYNKENVDKILEKVLKFIINNSKLFRLAGLEDECRELITEIKKLHKDK